MPRHSLVTLAAVCSASLLAASAARADDTAIQNAATFVCSSVAESPAFDDSTHFAPSFLQEIPHDEIVQALAGLYKEFGACQKAEPQAGKVLFLMADHSILEASLAVDTQGLITELHFLGVAPTTPLATWDDLKALLKQLPGQTGAALVLFDETPLVQTAGSDQPFAVGSTFKLTVLGALSKAIDAGKFRWNESLQLKEEWKSLPGGIMQDLPSSYTPSVYEFAQKMISISDNTATDELMHYLGKEDIEAMWPVMGIAPHRGNDPVLTTLEMMKLKWAVPAEKTQAYIDGTPAERRKILEEIASVPRDKVCAADPDACEKPTDIQTIEWFMTPEEACRAIHWLDLNGDDNVHQVLAANTPFVSTGPDSHWAYAGFKGGSEPGVFSGTYLLKAKDGRTGCLTVSWNDAAKPLSEIRFVGLLRQALGLAEKTIQ